MDDCESELQGLADKIPLLDDRLLGRRLPSGTMRLDSMSLFVVKDKRAVVLPMRCNLVCIGCVSVCVI